jgi:hypothetical protein
VNDQADDLLNFILAVETKPDFTELTRVLRGLCCNNGSGDDGVSANASTLPIPTE